MLPPEVTDFYITGGRAVHQSKVMLLCKACQRGRISGQPCTNHFRCLIRLLQQQDRSQILRVQ